MFLFYIITKIKAGKYPPNLLCIENECVNKKQFAMLMEIIL